MLFKKLCQLLKVHNVSATCTNEYNSYVYWTVHHLDSWIKIDQLMSLALFFAQRVSNASTFIFRSSRLCVGALLWFDVCWCYGVVRLGWCGILMQAEAIRWSIFIELEYKSFMESQWHKKLKYLERNLSQCPSIHHQHHTFWSETETTAVQWEGHT
jgi:hypothetical protein